MLIYRIIAKTHESNLPKTFCSLCLSFRKHVCALAGKQLAR
jgi:hypothetical protein